MFNLIVISGHISYRIGGICYCNFLQVTSQEESHTATFTLVTFQLIIYLSVLSGSLQAGRSLRDAFTDLCANRDILYLSVSNENYGMSSVVPHGTHNPLWNRHPLTYSTLLELLQIFLFICNLLEECIFVLSLPGLQKGLSYISPCVRTQNKCSTRQLFKYLKIITPSPLSLSVLFILRLITLS